MPEHTVAENLTRLTTARNDIADAIVAKGGTVNAGDGFEEFPADIATIPSGGGGESANMSDVNFYDYDGTIVDSYTASEFASLSAMPSNPTHEGLTAQGWNWSLADAKAYVNKYGKLNVGQMYITSDGKTRLYITLHDGRLSPTLGLAVNGSVDVDWGDGTAHSTMTGSSTTTAVYAPHTYAEEGDYVIAITPSSGSTFTFIGDSSNGSLVFIKAVGAGNGNRVYQASITKIETGNSVTSIGSTAFQACYALTSINIPDGVTSISDNAFQSCSVLTSITIPDGVTSISDNAFQSCSALTSLTIPDSVTSIGSTAFNACSVLTSITIPDGVTSISSNAFYNCYALTSITIPDGVTSIGNYAFYNCYALTSITIPDGVTSISGSAFQACRALAPITIPDGVTSISGSAFQACYALTSITIPDGVTSIGNYAFNACYALTSLTIPDSVTSIGNNAFYNCNGLGFIKFTSTTPPTVANANAFTGIPTDCIIYVPASALNTYKSASKYPSSSTYQYVGY